ncbi:MAG: hypothetical protein JSW16_07065 [Dehalococcoidales bacterium]|nr:MAG: hypothetical protein JSW16_07065 [Dehalococcoidales bacterium]
MAEVEQLIKTTLTEIERILSSKSVVGEPMIIEGNTIIPLVSIGFGFGGGGGTGGQKDKSEGAGSGTGGGGGVKPLGIIVVNQDGVRIEQVKGAGASFVSGVGDVISKAMEKRAEKKEE